MATDTEPSAVAHDDPIVFDSFLDLIKGFGQQSKPHYLREASAQINELTNLIEQDWLAQAIVGRTPEMALRQGFTIEGDSNGEIKSAFDRLNRDPFRPEGLLYTALFKGRGEAGASLLLVPDRGKPEQKAAPGNGVRRILVCRWDQLGIKSYVEDRNDPDCGRPETYELKSGVTDLSGLSAFNGQIFHASRVIPCEGAYCANPTPQRPWVSIIESCWATLADFGFSWEAISYLLRESSMLVLKMAGVHQALGSGKNTVQKNRMSALNAGKSVMRTIFLDPSANEDATRVTASFADIPALMQEMSRRVAGCARTPMTILWGMSPAGLNATGQSDLQQYYDYLGMYRETSVRPKLEYLLEQISGKPCKAVFPNLWVPTDLEKADLRSKNLAGDKILWEMEGLDAIRILVSRHRDGTLGINLPPDVLASYESILAKGGAEKTGALALTPSDVAYVILGNEARKSLGQPELAMFAGKTLARIKTEADTPEPIEPEDPPDLTESPDGKTGKTGKTGPADVETEPPESD